MGQASSKTVECHASNLSCAAGEPQEICDFGSPCDWTASSGCTSKVIGCACPPAFYSGEQFSNVPLFFKSDSDRATVASGGYMLWSLSVIITVYISLRTLESKVGIRRKGEWTSSEFPQSLRCSRRLFITWLSVCAAITCALAAFAAFARADHWGSCSQDDVCVYHSMFCEATRHASAVRHPANAWSNLPYIYTSIGILLLGAKEMGVLSPVTSRVYDPFRPAAFRDVVVRPYQSLDAVFALILLSMATFSFVWHSSNCTQVHFIDIGLMNCVIAYFPFRFLFSSVANLLGVSDADASGAAAVGYVALCAGLLYDMISKTTTFRHGFPTGVARAANGLSALETALYIGLPGLYPVPTLLLMAQRGSWGHIPAMITCVLTLPIAFMGHAAEKLVLDFRCDSTSLWTQPTATFHFFSGLTIAAAFVQSRALEV